MVSELDFCFNYAFLPRVVSSVTSPRREVVWGRGKGRGRECSVQSALVSVLVTVTGAHTQSSICVQYLWFCARAFESKSKP